MPRRFLPIPVLFLLFCPATASSQTFEPMARAANVRVPVELMRAPGEDVAFATAAAKIRTTGRFPVLVIPVLFRDTGEPMVTVERIEEILFGDGGRTLTTFYQEMSGGRLDVVGAVSPWVRTTVRMRDAAGSVDGHGFIGARSGDHFAEAIAAADASIDFRLYDNDGPDNIPDSGDDDGIVDAVTFKFTEISGSCGGPGFWPHRSWLRDEDGVDGIATEDIGHDGSAVRVYGYTTESAVECDGVTEQGAAVMAHEFGHVLGLPDFYRAVEGVELNQRHWMIGCFGLMGAGSWGCGNGGRTFDFGPSGLSPLSRSILGWGEPILVGPVRDAEYVLEPVQVSGRFLKIPLTETGGEYLLIEYRPRLGFDDALPDEGVLIYHVNPDADIFGGTYAETFPYYLVERDGSGGLRRTIPDGGDRGVAADYYGRSGADDSITPATWPGTHTSSGEASNVWIHSITVADGSARIRLSTTTSLTGTPLASPTSAFALERMELRYRIDGGTAPYTAVAPPAGMPVDGLTLRMDGSDVVVEGVPLAPHGAVRLPLHVTDADGEEWWIGPVVDFLDPVITDTDLLAPLVNPGNGSEALKDYLDRAGNANGTYDIGDLRAYFSRTRR